MQGWCQSGLGNPSQLCPKTNDFVIQAQTFFQTINFFENWLRDHIIIVKKSKKHDSKKALIQSSATLLAGLHVSK